jgi:hypothetical protein
MIDGVNLTKVHCKYIWKCHNEPGWQARDQLDKVGFNARVQTSSWK